MCGLEQSVEMDINESYSIPILFVADTHLGFDLPFRPRIKRRRRGIDFLPYKSRRGGIASAPLKALECFFANFERALAPALSHGVDWVQHIRKIEIDNFCHEFCLFLSIPHHFSLPSLT
jgi:hypothetical protein